MFTKLKDGALFYCRGRVVHGFGRGSKELGIPTANFDEASVSALPNSLENGVYFGWVKVGNDTVRKMVMNIGWNPFYKNVKRSMEVHVMHPYEHTFYGSTIQLIALKYSRPELDFDSLDALIKQIHADIDQANAFLDREESQLWKSNSLFVSTEEAHKMEQSRV